MPAVARDKFIKTIPTPTRVYSKSIGPVDIKRLGPTKRISTKRSLSQSIQTQTVLETLIETKTPTRVDSETQTVDFPTENSMGDLAVRLIKFLGGTIVSFMDFFQHIRK